MVRSPTPAHLCPVCKKAPELLTIKHFFLSVTQALSFCVLLQSPGGEEATNEIKSAYRE
jgi:hypothetical protein